MSARSLSITLLLSTALAACGTPYGSKLSIDYAKPPIDGSITVSDAKLYRREALINERRREVSYIDNLMAASEKDGFVIGPEINREIEVIRSLALSAGISFDPAAGQSYRSSSKTEALQQDINVLQLQLQLDQLKRDAALFREKLNNQTDLSNADLGKAGTPAAAGSPPTLTPADTAPLISRIDALQATLAERLGATIGGPRGVTIAGNPIDQFRDRAAYRQILTTARNAASLDELHDLDGAALYRLTFQVTTLPPKKGYERTAGLVKMQPVSGDVPDAAELQDIYLRWLDYLNRTMVAGRTDDPIRLDIQNLIAGSGNFEAIDLLYPAETVPQPASKPKKGGKAVAVAVPAPICAGLVPAGLGDPTCGRAMILLPAGLPRTSTTLAGDQPRYSSVTGGHVIALTGTGAYNATYDAAIRAANTEDVRSQLVTPGKCALLPVDTRAAINRDSATGKTDNLVAAAVSTLAAAPQLAQALRRLAAVAEGDNQRAAIVTAQKDLRYASERSSALLAQLGAGRCKTGERLFVAPPVEVPDSFRAVVTKGSKVRVYEVGPRQQVQQVSTAARAAEAFSLALALSAKVPSSGIAGNAGLGLSRSATGKVDAIERLPVVVGFASANAASPQFGWLLGPRVNIDPKHSNLDLAQGPQAYDLSADLSVAGWRTLLKLNVATKWAPDLAKIAEPSDKGSTVTVALRPAASEFAALTQLLANGAASGGQRYATIDKIAPARIKACAAATLVILGDNLWRATDVIVGGTRLGSSNIAVLPDMQGITVDIGAKTSFPTIGDDKVDVQILTPYGVAAKGDKALVVDGYGTKGCDPPDEKPAVAAVTAVDPSSVGICGDATFTLTGRDLENITEVRFGASSGDLAATAGKKKLKSRKVSFTKAKLLTIDGSNGTMKFFAADDALGSKSVSISKDSCPAS